MRVVFLSLAVHAVAFAFVMRMPRRARAPEVAPPVPIEIVEDEPPPAPQIETIARSEGGGNAAVATRGVASRAGIHVASLESSPEVGPTEGPSEAPSPAPTWSGSFFSLGPKEIGIGRDNPLLVASAAPSDEPKKKPSYGLGFRPSSEGPALSVLRDVTSRSLAPLNGRARFTVRIDADGKVLGIDLDDATGGPGWDDARRLALDEMKEKKIFVPQGARGLNVHFEIVSELSYPSGQKSSLEFGVRDGALVLPDESNIGQRPTRKIRAHHLSTEIL